MNLDMKDAQAITVWCDETEVSYNGGTHHVIGNLITDSDTEEFRFLNEAIKLRKKHRFWTTLHGAGLSYSEKELAFMEDLIKLFWNTERVYFHVFVYKENRTYANNGFEKYFAKQSAFALGMKLRKEGYPINTLFSQVGTVRFLFDRRTGDSSRGLDSDYKDEIKKQLRKQSKRSDDLTVRFSFVSSECFDLMQLTDIFLYMIKLHGENKISPGCISVGQQKLVSIFEKYFLNEKMQKLSDYEYSEKVNFFISNR